MNIVANDLLKDNGIILLLNDELKTQFKLLNNKIIEENKGGNNYLLYSLPLLFPNIPYNPEKCSLFIYEKILSELKKNGFKVKIQKMPNKIILYIRWNTL